jgi:predicted acetyltransferase
MIQVHEYIQAEWTDQVESLFAEIYPQWDPRQCSRMAYPETLPLHVLTLLAVTNNSLIGQLNVFRVGQDTELSNIGYHVHPEWRRHGIASLLLCDAWTTISSVCKDGMVIQVEKENTASYRLAEHAGFSLADDSLMKRYRKHLRILQSEGGLVYHHKSTKQPPNKAVQRTALRAATDL